jgi:hypothetical protein
MEKIESVLNQYGLSLKTNGETYKTTAEIIEDISNI